MLGTSPVAPCCRLVLTQLAEDLKFITVDHHYVLPLLVG